MADEECQEVINKLVDFFWKHSEDIRDQIHYDCLAYGEVRQETLDKMRQRMNDGEWGK